MNNEMNNNNVNPAMNFGAPASDNTGNVGLQNNGVVTNNSQPVQTLSSVIPPVVGSEVSQPGQIPVQPIEVPAQSSVQEPVQPVEVQAPISSPIEQPIMQQPIQPTEVMQQSQPVQSQVTPVEMPIQQPPVQPTVQEPIQPQQPVVQPMVNNIDTSGISGSQINGDSNLDNTEKKKTPILMLLITIIIVVGVAVFLFLYLTGKINFGGTGTSSDQGNGNVVDNADNQNVELASWMNYLLEQNITEIKLSKVTTDGSEDTEVVLTTDQLKEIFSKMMNYGLVELYTDSEDSITQYTELYVTYSKGDSNYTLSVRNDLILLNNSINIADSDLVSSLENSNPAVDELNKDKTDVFAEFKFDNLDISIYDEYFTTIDEDNTDTTDTNQDEQ